MQIAPSVTLGVAAMAKELAAQGRDVFSFAAGEPDFDTPQYIKDAAIRALQQGETKYTPVAGTAALQKAIAEKLERENGLSYKANQVVVSNGAKHSLFNLFVALLNEGDEVIIPSPYWLSYPEMVRMAGGESVFVACSEKNEYKLQPAAFEAAITPRTKAVILNSPSNPIGVVYTPNELKALSDVAVNHGLYIVSDEIYEKMVYDGAVHVSPGSFSKSVFDRTITVNGFSKSYSMTGWRLGYMAGPPEVVKAVCALQSHSTSGPNTFAQFGALAALQVPSDSVEQMVKAFAERGSYIYERLIAIKGVTCVRPQGAFYVLPNISRFGLDSVTFSERLIKEKGVAVVPGVSFGADQCVRLSYACGMDTIKQGMDGLAEFVAGL
jgi:aspartate aminotransferase